MIKKTPIVKENELCSLELKSGFNEKLLILFGRLVNKRSKISIFRGGSWFLGEVHVLARMAENLSEKTQILLQKVNIDQLKYGKL